MIQKILQQKAQYFEEFSKINENIKYFDKNETDYDEIIKNITQKLYEAEYDEDKSEVKCVFTLDAKIKIDGFNSVLCKKAVKETS